MKRALSLLVVAVFLAAPLAGRAQTPPAGSGTAAGAAEKPAAPADKPAPPKPAGVTFTPYGFVLLNAYFNAGAFSGSDYGAFVVAPNNANADSNFIMQIRNTRLGTRIGFPDAMGAKLGAVVEADFRGGFGGATNFDWYQPVPRLRLAYATANWKVGENYTVGILLGQEYGLVAPLFATSIAYTAAPLFMNAGNGWHRAPQVRVQGEMGGPIGVQWAFAALSPLDRVDAASAGAAATDVGAGNRSRTPRFEGRLAGNFKQGAKKLAELGVGGRWGRDEYVLSNGARDDVNTLLVGLDAQVNLPFVSLRGEALNGSNIEDYLFASAPNSGVRVFPTNVKGVRAKGAWAQAVVTPIAPLQLMFGGGVERWNADDVAPVTGAGTYRNMNRMLHGGFIYAVSKNLRTGVEVLKTLTNYRLAGGRSLERNGIQTSANVQYSF